MSEEVRAGTSTCLATSLEVRALVHRMISAVVGCSLAFAACGESSPEESISNSEITTAPPFLSLFHEDRLVTLDEPDTALITAIERIAVRQQDDAWAIPDRMEAAVRIYDEHGRLQKDLGGFGDGPGEYRAPAGVAFADDGSLLVADWARPRITRYAPTLSYDTAFFIPNGPAIFPILSLNGNMVIGEQRPPSLPDALFWTVYDSRGHKTAAFVSQKPS